MFIYFVLILLITISRLISKNRRMFYYLSGFLILMVMGMRHSSVGTDTASYLNMYLYRTEDYIAYFKVATFKSLLLNDPLYFLYCYVLLKIGVNQQLFLFISSMIIVALIMRFMYENTEGDYISIVSFITIGLFTLMLSAFRQGIALAIISISYKYILKDNPYKFILFVLIATGFHITAICFLPAYWIVKILEKKEIKKTLLISIIASFLFSNVFYSIVVKMNMGPRFLSYINENPVKTNPLLVLMYIFIAILCIFFLKLQDGKNDKTNTICFNLYFIGVGIMILSLQNTIISRFSYYYMLILPVLLGNNITRITNKNNKIIVLFSCIAVELLFFVISTHGSVLGIDNYMFFWE